MLDSGVVTAAAKTVLDDTTVGAMLTTLGGAALASPTFTGTPAAPTASAGTNTTQLATTAFVTAAVATATVTMSDTAPGSPTQGQFWFNTANAKLYISWNDGSSTQWIQVSS
jgi:hypothetical protein